MELLLDRRCDTPVCVIYSIVSWIVFPCKFVYIISCLASLSNMIQQSISIDCSPRGEYVLLGNTYSLEGFKHFGHRRDL